MKPKNPCMKCNERDGFCHARCETYAEYQKRQEEYRIEIDYAKNKDWGGKDELRKML